MLKTSQNIQNTAPIYQLIDKLTIKLIRLGDRYIRFLKSDISYKRNLVYLLLCSLLSFHLQAQTADSTQANQYLQTAQQQLDTLDYEKAIQLSQRAIAIYDGIDQKHPKIGIGYTLLGDTYLEQGQYDTALNYYGQAKQNAIQYYGETHPLIAQANNDIGRCHWKKGAIEEAIRYFGEALTMRSKLFGEQHPKVADTYNNLGNCAFDKSDLNAARSYYEKALNIRLALLDKNDPDIASSYNNLGSCFRRAGQYERAIDYYSKSIKIREARLGESHPKVAQSCANLGLCYEQMGQLEEAIRYYNRSLRICQTHYQETHPDIATAYLGLGGSYSKSGVHTLALKYFEKALEIQKANFPADSPNLISVYNNLANAYKNLGDYNKAMLFYENNIHILNKTLGPRHAFTAATYNNIGLVQVKLVQFQDALESYRKALSIYEAQKNPQRIANTWNNIGTCLREQARFPQAIEAYQQSATISEKLYGKDHVNNAAVYYNIGNCLGEEEQYTEAVAYYNRAIALVSDAYSPTSTKLAVYKTSIGTIQYKQQNYLQALQQFEEAVALQNLEVNDSSAVNYIESPMEVLHLLSAKTKTLYGLAMNKKGSTEAATYLEEAVKIVDFSIRLIGHLRQDYQEEYSKRKLSETAHEIFKQGIAACHQLNQQTSNTTFLEKAFTYSEKSRGSLLLEALVDQKASSAANIPDSLLEQESRLKSSIANYEKQLQAALQKTVDATLINEYNNQLFEQKQAYEQLIKRFEADFPAYYQLKYEEYIVPVEAIQQQLSNEEVIVEYFVADTIVYIFLVDQTAIHLEEVVVDSLVKEVTLFREGISMYYRNVNAQTEQYYRSYLIQYLRAAHFLYQKLIQPIEDRLPNKLTIINGNVLNYLPFDALVASLPTGELHRLRDISYLIKKYDINYAYSATLLQRMQEKEEVSTPPNNLLAFAPIFKIPNRQNLAPLAHNIPEVELIKALLPDSDLFTGAAATKQQFVALAKDYQVLHLATHGQADADLGDYSFLAFTDIDSIAKEETILYAKDIYNLPLKADLVVLSACETGKGEVLRGEGVVSLGRAFFYAGAKSILTTLWSINDASTKIIIASFYKNLQAGASKSTALRLAKLEYLEKADDPNPFFWAAFVLTGDTGEVAVDSPSLLWVFLLFLLGVLGILCLVYLVEGWW